MKRAMLGLLAAGALASGTGCAYVTRRIEAAATDRSRRHRSRLPEISIYSEANGTKSELTAVATALCVILPLYVLTPLAST